MHCAVLGVLTGISLCAGPNASAVEPLIKINPSTEVPNPYEGNDNPHGDGMVGWNFQLLVPFTVTQVGWYDEDTTNGLSRAFQVGLWKGEGFKEDPGTPHTFVSSSLIGDPNNGLIIPAGTNASLLGVWRVVDLASPLTLQPGFYQLAGLDTLTTTDVIKHVVVNSGGTPLQSRSPGSPLVIGAFFDAGVVVVRTNTNFGPTPRYYLWWGLELGPMLFGSWTPSKGLSISLFPFTPPEQPGVLLTWPTGTLQQADVATGPYTAVTNATWPYPAPTNATSPYLIPFLSPQKFYRLGPVE